MKNIFLSILFIISCINLHAQSSWKLIEESSLKGSISGNVSEGFLFKTDSKEFFIISEGTRQRVRTRNPNVKIYQSGALFKLVIDDFEEPVVCIKTRNVIETQINGEFKGWDGETTFKLMNGQVWKQSSYAYTYHYAYSPEVFIYQYKGEWILKVEDLEETSEVYTIK
jgi:hypothetical protein